MIVTALGYLVTVGVALSGVFLSRQNRVPRRGRTVLCISLRTLPLFLLFFVVCQRLDVNAVAAVAALALVFWVLLIGPSALGLGGIGVLYVLRQWILGWPDREDFLLNPPLPREAEHRSLDELVGKMGVAGCPLRPGGLVVLDESEYPAHSDLGYIDRGAQVIVVGRKGTSLLVRPAASSLAGPARS